MKVAAVVNCKKRGGRQNCQWWKEEEHARIPPPPFFLLFRALSSPHTKEGFEKKKDIFDGGWFDRRKKMEEVANT